MSLFNRPAWAKPQDASPDDLETDIFRHSDRNFSNIVADQERRKHEKAERKKAKVERRSSAKHHIKDEPLGESSKRRRITLEDGEALLGSVGLKPEADVEQDITYDDPEDDPRFSPVRRSPRIARHIDKAASPTIKKPRTRTQVIDLGDSDDEDEPFLYDARPPVQTVKADDESDDEFAELARLARQQRLKKEDHAKKSQTPDNGAYSPSPALGAMDTGQRSLPTPPPDPTIELFVSSRIPDTNPLIVHRKLSQRLQEIRQVWCTKQKFSKEVSDGIFFIYRMRRVYDVTTCKSLGLEADSFGNITMKGADGKEGVEKVHLEAVTEQIFQKMKGEQAEERRRRSGDLPPMDSTEAGAEDGETQQPKEEPLIRLTLKAKGREDFKLKVKPSTIFSKIAAAYCKTQKIDGSRLARLEFDGESLSPDDEVQSTEVSDLDCLDVHIN